MRKSVNRIIVSVMILWVTSVMAMLLVSNYEPTVQDNVSTQAAEQAPHRIMVLVNGKETSMDLSDYLTGVLISEMPAEFHMEAKKAQAVAARTFALYANRHGSCAVCTDPGCCQGYLTEAQYYAYGGTQEGIRQATIAVEETENMVIVYKDSLIEATYFSCSGGRTEDAVAVWGTDIPYLQAVDSPGEESAPVFTESVRFSALEFQQALGVTLVGSPLNWFGEVYYTDGYGVSSIEIGGKKYSGNELRFQLKLRSTRFSVTALSDSVIITTRGYGHRVGLSQFGADAMARKGSGWQEILAYYYQNTQLTQYEKRTD